MDIEKAPSKPLCDLTDGMLALTFLLAPSGWFCLLPPIGLVSHVAVLSCAEPFWLALARLGGEIWSRYFLVQHFTLLRLGGLLLRVQLVVCFCLCFW